MTARAGLRIAATLLIGALLPGSCGDGPTGAGGGGRVTYSLTTPFSDDGGVTVAITMPRPDVAEPGTQCPTCQFYARQRPGELRLLIVGNLSNGPLFSVIAEPGEPPTARVLEGASRDGTPRDPGAYVLTADR